MKIDDGDIIFDFLLFPAARRCFERFSAIDAEGQPHAIVRAVTLRLS